MVIEICSAHKTHLYKCHVKQNPDSKVHEAYMGPTWGRQDPGGPHVGPVNLAIRENPYKI